MPKRSQRRLDALETQYREQLTAALIECAKGWWGLFGHNAAAIARMDVREQAHWRNASVEDLIELGDEINCLRRGLGHPEPFGLHQRLMHARASVTANTPGEPKLAQQWLDELQS